jgi:hypothetical protein
MVQKKKQSLVFLIQHHENKIRCHSVDVKSRNSVWLLMFGSSSFAFATWHGAFSHIKT